MAVAAAVLDTGYRERKEGIFSNVLSPCRRALYFCLSSHGVSGRPPQRLCHGMAAMVASASLMRVLWLMHVGPRRF